MLDFSVLPLESSLWGHDSIAVHQRRRRRHRQRRRDVDVAVDVVQRVVARRVKNVGPVVGSEKFERFVS